MPRSRATQRARSVGMERIRLLRPPSRRCRGADFAAPVLHNGDSNSDEPRNRLNTPFGASGAAKIEKTAPPQGRSRGGHSRAHLRLPPRHSAAFGRCDITLPLAAPANELVEEALAGGTRLFVASYVVAENAVALRDSDFVFFEELFARAPAGTLMLVLETTHRQFPAIARAAWRGGGDAVAAACPRVRSNRGYSLCLLKRSAAPAGVEGGEADAFGPESEELSELFSRFEEDDRRQRRKALDEESVG
ncbi:hypothetical protein EMIHUDRAFT_218088 [Emiliania huxleyi CCMP1516]|uniref:Uncharacterized protein n=2 Tax=Emiliania huxleyi TaxID=2903 RepID=A0A0D3I9T9_EMIH1|nr:hypothetical protein EMIHUDRAFT_218088 [Emiliania huxleyi CCMP1516]EOD08024.1 hypothetical protein EMIHUDRAFT_218088 [Emiliania huxleyi CCMP1516]|eukprot:XP_005760453.1 hypothetical protein EMIHUDRAFT_218088 [Emiliania huxleyi CCMP1516]